MSRHQYSLFEHHVHQGVVCIRDQLFFVDQLWVFEDKRCNCLTDRSKHYTTTHLLWWICTCCTQCFNSIVTCSSTGLSASVSCDCCITCCIASTDLLGSLCSISEQCTLQSCNASIIGLLLCRFWWFLTVQGALITWGLLDAVSAWSLHPQLTHGFMPGFQVFLASVVLVLIFLFDWGLWIFHSFLLATGRTTNEHVYRRNGPVAYLQHVPRKVSAFDEGVVKNVRSICCAQGPGLYKLPPRDELIEAAQIETVWDNRYYSCCR